MVYIEIERSSISPNAEREDTVDAMAFWVANTFFRNSHLHNSQGRKFRVFPFLWRKMPFIEAHYFIDFDDTVSVIAKRFEANPLVLRVDGKKHTVKWLDGFGRVPSSMARDKETAEYYFSFTPELIKLMPSLAFHWDCS